MCGTFYVWCENGGVSSPLSFDFGEVYVVVIQAEEDKKGLVLNGMDQFLIYTNYINLLGRNFMRLSIKKTQIVLYGNKDLAL